MAKKPKMPQDIETKCHGIIHGASVAAGGVAVGIAQIPLADNAVITPIQIGMIIALAKVFDRSITKEAAFGVLKGAGAAYIGRNISQVLVGWVPGFGNAINTATAAGLTETIGWMSASQFYDEWLRDGHTVNDRPKSFSDTSDEVQEEKTDNAKKHRDELCAQAELFIDGQKFAKGTDKEEFYALFNEMGYELAGLQDDDSFRKTYERLAECMKY